MVGSLNLSKYFDLTGQVAIVTGGNQGIGFGIAQALADAGASVVIASRREDCGRDAANKLSDAGAKAIFVSADVSNKHSIDAAVRQVLKKLGHINILVNNAGVIWRGPSEATPDEETDRLITVNIKGVYFFSAAVFPHMRKQGKGKIINLSSVSAVVGRPELAIYSATKAAVLQLTKCLAVDWAYYRINVNAIAPGFIQTDMNREYLDADADRGTQMLQRIPWGRFGTPEDLGPLAIYLSSNASDYVTGQIFIVDGGWSMG